MAKSENGALYSRIHSGPGGPGTLDTLTLATENIDKVAEMRRILGPAITVEQVVLKVNEIQDPDPDVVIREKAIAAYRANGNQPIIVEDTALHLFGAEDLLRPTDAKHFTRRAETRRTVCNIVAHDPRARAEVWFAVCDGKEVHIRYGATTGKIASGPRGAKGFGWDDIFEPDEQEEGQHKTFAEMTDDEKDNLSMRTRALQDLKEHPFNVGRYTIMVSEPDDDDMARVRWEKMRGEQQVWFGDMLEARGSPGVFADDRTSFYRRYSVADQSPSLGLVVTNVEHDKVEQTPDGRPVIYQMGPRRIDLAVAARRRYFEANQKRPEVLQVIRNIDSGKTVIAPRANNRSPAIEEALGMSDQGGPIRAIDFGSVGYMKHSSDQRVSRTTVTEELFHKVGRYARRPIGLGSMPPVTGQLDVITTAALGHMMSFIPRNSLFADENRRIRYAEAIQNRIHELHLTDEQTYFAMRNIGLSVGSENPEHEVALARRFHDEFGINLFRIYTINSDPRVMETAQGLREIGDIELFVGQVPLDLAHKLVDDDRIKPDAILFGHGGGRQCTSAETGMVISTVEELYRSATDKNFNGVSLGVEGGVGKSVGPALLMGADFVLYNNQLVHGTVEAGGGLFLCERESGELVQPYPGSASPVTQLIEASVPGLMERRVGDDGRTHNPEGKPGFMYYEKKANSMAFHVRTMLTRVGRTLADLGLRSMAELREYQKTHPDVDLFRIPNSGAQIRGSAYGQSS